MINEEYTKVVRLKSKDEELFKKEGVIIRRPIDAREILASGGYEVVPNITKVVGVANVLDDKVELIKSMNTKTLTSFVKNEGLNVNISSGNLVEKRSKVIDALQNPPEQEVEQEVEQKVEQEVEQEDDDL